MAPQQSKQDPELRLIPSHILTSKHDRFTIKLSKGEAKVYLYQFDLNKGTDELAWAVDYWIRNREAIPTMKKGKCGVCSFKEDCPSSLYLS